MMPFTKSMFDFSKFGRLNRASYVLLFSLLLTISAVAQSPRTHWYRYYDNGVPQTSKVLSKEHIKNGYEELDSGFRVIRKIEPYSRAKIEAEDAKRKAEQAKKEKRQHLVKIYGSSKRATRKRSQLIGDVTSKRAFSLQQLITANSALQAEISEAAKLEKKGKAVPQALKDKIKTQQDAVNSARLSLDNFMNQQLDEIEHMTHDIRQLRKFERQLGGGY